MDTPHPIVLPEVPHSRNSRIRGYAIALIVGLVIGLVPTGLQLWQAQRDNDQLRRQLTFSELDGYLARAAVLARHGDYTTARDAASSFFSGARLAVDQRTDLSANERTRLQAALAERDTLITLLARSDPAGADRTATLYISWFDRIG